MNKDLTTPLMSKMTSLNKKSSLRNVAMKAIQNGWKGNRYIFPWKRKPKIFGFKAWECSRNDGLNKKYSVKSTFKQELRNIHWFHGIFGFSIIWDFHRILVEFRGKSWFHGISRNFLEMEENCDAMVRCSSS